MVTISQYENRNTLAEKVVSGEVSFEKAITGLAQAEVRIFYRKLDKAFRTKHAKSLHSVFGMPLKANSIHPGKAFTFLSEPFVPFKVGDSYYS